MAAKTIAYGCRLAKTDRLQLQVLRKRIAFAVLGCAAAAREAWLVGFAVRDGRLLLVVQN